MYSNLEIVFQLITAVILGGLIGAEREHIKKPAGVRTYALVSLGSALFTIISVLFFKEFGNAVDPSRVAASIVAGVGFLGLGIIIHQGLKVRGLTTAAGVWVAAAIGMAVGLKLYVVAIATAAITFVVLWLLLKLNIEQQLQGSFDHEHHTKSKDEQS